MASTYLALNVHVIFATKGRAPVIADEWREDLHAYIGGTIRGLQAVPTIVGGVADHVHFLAGLRGTHAVADLVREIKKVSNQWAREKYRGFQWQDGYAALSVSPSEIDRVVAYIGNQDAHHRKLSSEDELRAILAEAGIEFKEKFFE
jgi:putative transposase